MLLGKSSARGESYGWSLLLAVVLVTLIAGLASIPHCSAVGVVLLPGALLAALVFPQGIDSSAGIFFLALAGLADSALLALPIMGVWKVLIRKWQR